MRLNLIIFAIGVIFFISLTFTLIFIDEITIDPDKSTSFSNCSSDWYITGYFTPVESDYSGDFQKITFDDEVKQFKSDFLSVVKTEGWGKTISGEYVGWYDDSFHISDVALDSHGEPLLVHSVAVDSEIIKQKTNLVIPNLPTPWNEIIFESSDIGPSIKGKHIDVYVGEGKQAELETFRITSTENNVCIEFFKD
ncbi:MAG: murein transglycosylase [Thaumarchaeota archaeon]|nr:murein transglycosylase [Nitrososphaerota archaeon]